MINIEQSGNLLNIAVMGEFTLGDFQLFESQATEQLMKPAPANLLFDLRAMISYSVDVAWEEIVFFGREHPGDFGKIAVVTDSQWLTWHAWLARIFVDADIRAFADYKDAVAWASSEA